MTALVEIADKMPTIGELWSGNFQLTLPILLIQPWSVILRRLGTVLGVGLCLLLLALSFDQAYTDASIRRAVWSEMGGRWVLHSLLSSVVPLLVIPWAEFIRSRSRGAHG